ncbi:MAG: quinol:cytochrome C oxidoreductase [Planctomycetota bacterium]
MHEVKPAKITSPIVTLQQSHIRTIPIALIIGAVGIGLAATLSAGSAEGIRRFMHIYLVNFCYILSVSLGCLFFIIISHLTRAGWNATIRRIAELFAMCLAPMFLLALPILVTVILKQEYLYIWTTPGWSIHGATGVSPDRLPPIEQLKGAYLNSTFFAIRVVLYFALWTAMAWFFLGNSLKQDVSGDKSLTTKMQSRSAPILILFAASIVFSSFDFEMSLSPLFFSTMFPVYFFAGAFLSALTTIMLTGFWLQRSGRVTDEITDEHYHDLGKMMQGMTIFWGYIAFSQFLLIWYANIPEETFWYRVRGQEGWFQMGILLIIGHLFVPFFLLMGRGLRRNKLMLTISGIVILVMHWFDHYWLVMPEVNPDAKTFTLAGTGILIDVCCLIGMLGIYLALFNLVTRNKPLIALKDPRLGEALNHEVH